MIQDVTLAVWVWGIAVAFSIGVIVLSGARAMARRIFR